MVWASPDDVALASAAAGVSVADEGGVPTAAPTALRYGCDDGSCADDDYRINGKSGAQVRFPVQRYDTAIDRCVAARSDLAAVPLAVV